MRKNIIIRAILIVFLIIISVAVPIWSVANKKREQADNKNDSVYINIWQIDGFEGGVGSRKQFIERLAQNTFKGQKIYFTVTTLTSQSARNNLQNGVTPDLISYPSGFYGIESLINSKDFTYKSWCRGCYCYISLDTNCDFSDIDSANTIVNGGIDNQIGIVTALSGLNSAERDLPLNAYLKLLNGKYKYLLGTQRDVYRLTKRGVQFKAKPITEFNDLYQNLSIITKNKQKYDVCLKIANLLECADTSQLGLFPIKNGAIAEELKQIKCDYFTYTIKGATSQNYVEQLTQAQKENDLNKLKLILH